MITEPSEFNKNIFRINSLKKQCDVLKYNCNWNCEKNNKYFFRKKDEVAKKKCCEKSRESSSEYNNTTGTETDIFPLLSSIVDDI